MTGCKYEFKKTTFQVNNFDKNKVIYIYKLTILTKTRKNTLIVVPKANSVGIFKIFWNQ